MNYTILLFDLDDTLLDFEANEACALDKLFSSHGYQLADLFPAYDAVNKRLWREYESGSIGLERVLNTRFSETMAKFGATVDGGLWESEYRVLLGEGHQLIDGAPEALKVLSKSHRLFVITNGVRETQLKRLKMSGLFEYFEDIFDSQSIGSQKPSGVFFDYVKAHIADFDKSRALVIGDSLGTDIKGGMEAGIDTCWLNRHGRENASGIQSTYTITALSELPGIC
jgi:2-haloacid dehalogenase